MGLGGHLGGASPFSSSPYLQCSPWLRTVGRKKRELREKKGTRQSLVSKGGKHNWRRGQEEESLPVCPHRITSLRILLGEMPHGLTPVLMGKAVDGVQGDLGSSCNPAACAMGPWTPLGLSCPCQKMLKTGSLSLQEIPIFKRSVILFSNWQLQQGGISFKPHALRPRAKGRCEHCSVPRWKDHGFWSFLFF